MQDEIGQVVVVGLGMEKRVCVLGRSLQKNLRDRDELEELQLLMQH